MLRSLVRLLKKLPIDLGQYEVRYRTKGKRIAFDLVPDGAGKKALDVGCRDGYWSEKLKTKGYTVVSCDLEPHYPGALTLNANQRLPLGDSEFDLVWCSEVIEHLLDAKFTVAEFKRILKPGGALVMTTMDMGKNEVAFSEQSEGVYEGTGKVEMAGPWELVVTAKVAGMERQKKFPVTVAR